MNLTEIAATLRSRARELRITQEQLRSQAGLSRQTLTNVLGGSSDYRLTTLLALADRLGFELVLVPKGAAPGLAAGDTRPAAVKTGVQAALESLEPRAARKGGSA
jgi:transcriptional regulator with XRE-family HTH domain